MVWYNYVIRWYGWYGITMSYLGMVWYNYVIRWYGWYGITMSYGGMVGMV